MCKRKPGSTLTDKEKMFCEEYILDLDATKAAIRAGYSEASAKTTAYHIRQRPDVAAYITQLLDDRYLRLRITADEVLLEIAKIAFSEPVNFNEEDIPEENVSMPCADDTQPGEAPQAFAPGKPQYTAATMYRVTDIDPETGRRSVRYFSLAAKISALKLLGMHLGLFGGLAKLKTLKPNIIFPPKRQVLLSSETDATK